MRGLNLLRERRFSERFIQSAHSPLHTESTFSLHTERTSRDNSPREYIFSRAHSSGRMCPVYELKHILLFIQRSTSTDAP